MRLLPFGLAAVAVAVVAAPIVPPSSMDLGAPQRETTRQTGADRGSSIDEKLFEAIRIGDVARVRVLLAKGANPNANADQANDRPPLLSLGGTGDQKLAIARLLVARGAQVNYRQPETGETPLFSATRDGDVPLVRYLLAKGAKIEASDTRGTTPLHAAVRHQNPAMVRELLAHGANVAARTFEEKIEAPDTQKDPGFRKMWEENRRQYIEAASRLYEPGYRESGQTPIFGLVAEWNEPIYRLLTAAGADPRATDDNGWTILHHAVRYGDPDLVKTVLAKGISPNAATKSGFRPLHVATRVGFGFPSQEVGRVLLAAGADPAPKNAAGQSPIDLLRADAARALGEALYNPDEGLNQIIPLYLELANEFVALLEPQGSPITPPAPVVDERGRRYAPIKLGRLSFENEEELTAERAVRVENGRAILDLRFVRPSSDVTLTLQTIELEQYESITPVPLTLKIPKGETTSLLIAFPIEAARGGAVSLDFESSTEGIMSGGGSLGEGPGLNPYFVSGSGKEGEPVSVAHKLAGRTVVFRIDSATIGGKPVKGLAGREFLIEADRPVRLPGLTRGPTVKLSYRMRALPNLRWRKESIEL